MNGVTSERRTIGSQSVRPEPSGHQVLDPLRPRAVCAAGFPAHANASPHERRSIARRSASSTDSVPMSATAGNPRLHLQQFLGVLAYTSVFRSAVTGGADQRHLPRIMCHNAAFIDRILRQNPASQSVTRGSCSRLVPRSLMPI